MTARLTLVTDRDRDSIDVPVETLEERRGDASASPSASQPRGRGRGRSWVHSAWVPTPRLTRVPSLPLTENASVLPPASAPEARSASRGLADDRGAVTAEYAVVLLAAVAFAGLLVAIMRSNEVRQMLVDLVQNALGSAG